MLQAIIFDFDGVIADTEPLHFRAFESVLARRGIALSQEEYFHTYLGLNDAAFVQRLSLDRGVNLSAIEAERIRRDKDAAYEGLVAAGLPLLPGVRDWINAAGSDIPLGICSGARRQEILAVLRQHEIEHAFMTIVATEDVRVSKPDPAGYVETVRRFNVGNKGLEARRVLAIEDSLLGIRAGKSAGLIVLAVLGAPDHASRAADEARKSEADLFCDDLTKMSFADVASKVRG